MKNQMAFICILMVIIFFSVLEKESSLSVFSNASNVKRFPTSSEANIKDFDYSIDNKTVKIFYPSTHKDWKDKLQGAYCRNKAHTMLKNNHEMLARVSKIRCEYYSMNEVASFDITKSFNETEAELTLPFTVSKFEELDMYKSAEIISFLVSDKWQWKEIKSDTLVDVRIKLQSSIINNFCVNILIQELEDAFYTSMQTPETLISKLTTIKFDKITASNTDPNASIYDSKTKTLSFKIKDNEFYCKPSLFDEYKSLVFSSNFKKRTSKIEPNIALESHWLDSTLEANVKKIFSLSELKNDQVASFIKKINITADYSSENYVNYNPKESTLNIHFKFPLSSSSNEVLLKEFNSLAETIVANNSIPEPIWNGEHDNAAEWTRYTLDAIDQYEPILLSNDFDIKDTQNFCPKYNDFSSSQKRNFWLYFVSVLTKYESDFKPSARYAERGKLRGIVSVGLLSMSYKSARDSYDCKPISSKEADLKNEKWNLQCGVKIIQHRLNVEPYFNGESNDGIAAYFGPLKQGRNELKGIKSYLKLIKACEFK